MPRSAEATLMRPSTTPINPAPVETLAAKSADHRWDDDPARRMRALAQSCTDGLAALAYAQFADLLDPDAVQPARAPEPAARSR
jgi:hypothetical protein